MKTIKEIALEVAGEFLLDAVGKQNAQAFAESVLQQYLAQQEPVAWVNTRCQGSIEWNSKFNPPNSAELFLAPPIKPGFVLVPESALEQLLQAVKTICKDQLAASQEVEK